MQAFQYSQSLWYAQILRLQRSSSRFLIGVVLDALALATFCFPKSGSRLANLVNNVFALFLAPLSSCKLPKSTSYVLQLCWAASQALVESCSSASQPFGSAISASLASAVQRGTTQIAQNQVIARKLRIRTVISDVDMHDQSHSMHVNAHEHRSTRGAKHALN